MQIIADANPIISMLIKPGKPIELFFLEELELIAPALLFEELERNRDEILEKSGFSAAEFGELIDILKQRIKIIPEEEFVDFRKEAEAICPDEKDIVYFALALYLKCPIWSNEKQLKKQNHIVVYATHELIKLFEL